ncbi:Secreted RxLR effector protein 161-like protein [Drosera capensis]
MDVKIIFLNGDLMEEIYIKKTEGFVIHGIEDKVCRLGFRRPDIAFIAGMLSRFTSNPKKSHWVAIERLMRYLKGTLNFGLFVWSKDIRMQVGARNRMSVRVVVS